MVSFIADRNPEFITEASDLEEAYNQVYALLRNSELRVDTEAIVTKIAEIGSKSPADVKKQIMSELSPILDRLTEIQLKDDETDPAVTVSSYRRETPFSTARKDNLAPYFFYQYGFNNSVDLKRFALLGSGKPLEHLVTSIKAMAAEIDGLKVRMTEMERTILKEPKFRGEKLHSIKVQRELGRRIKSYLPPRDQLDILKSEALSYAQRYADAYDPSSVGAKEEQVPEWWQRGMGSVVGGTLQTFSVLIKNALDNMVYGGLNLAHATGQSGFTANASALLWHMPWVLARTIPSAAYSAVRSGPLTFMKGVPAALRALSKSKGLDKTMGPLRGLFSPAVDEFAMVMPFRIWEAKMLRKRGLGMSLTPEDTMESFEGDLVTGGRGVGAYKNDNPHVQTAVRGLQSILGGFEAGIALGGRPIFPRVGDITGNSLISRTGLQFVWQMEHRLRKVYARRVEQGVPLTDPLSEEEILGHYLGVFKANRMSFNDALNIFGKAGITNFQSEAQRFFRELEAAPDGKQTGLVFLKELSQGTKEGVRFLSPQKTNRVADVFVTMTNAATPGNRPLIIRTSKMWQSALSLMGWGLNSYQKYGEQTWFYSRSRQGRADERVKQAFASSLYFAGALLIGIPVAWLGAWLIRLVIRYLFGKEDYRRLPHEATTPTGKAKAIAGLASATIPMVGPAVEAMWSGTPGRAIHHPGSLAIGKVTDMAKFGIGVAATGDFGSVDNKFPYVHPPYGTARLTHSLFPMSQALSRFSEVEEGKRISVNVSRLIRKYYLDRDLIESPMFRSGLQGALQLSALNPLKEKFTSAVARGDINTAYKMYDQMIILADEMGKEDPRHSVHQSLRGLTPLSYALGSKPTEAEFYHQISGMPKEHRDFVTGVLGNF
ncbi:MAG TPA: hypothetical protein EYN66_16140, partial [Myxococcales bacterium]|nr:hypothetical protein [Myxococcales bacterium]